MPHSVFFLGGYAIHGTTEIKRLGRPVSHGCIRLHPSNAARLFQLIREVGKANTAIVIRR
jgi:lipoprotein-anchoring transpeptidase ErfK/SrfK